MLAVRSGAKELLARAVAEILTLRPRVPVHALANQLRLLVASSVATGLLISLSLSTRLMTSFQAVALGHSVATAAKSLRASHPSKRAFPDVALRVFCELADGQSQSSAVSTASVATSSAKFKSTSAVNSKAAAAMAPGISSCSARTISPAMLRELLGYLMVEFPKRIQTQVLQRLVRPAGSAPGASDDTSEPVGFDKFVRAVDACLLLEGSP